MPKMKHIYPLNLPINPGFVDSYLYRVAEMVNHLAVLGVVGIYPQTGSNGFTEIHMSKRLFDCLCMEEDGSYGPAVEITDHIIDGNVVVGQSYKYIGAGVNYSCLVPNKEYFENMEDNV